MQKFGAKKPGELTDGQPLFAGESEAWDRVFCSEGDGKEQIVTSDAMELHFFKAEVFLKETLSLYVKVVIQGVGCQRLVFVFVA